MTRKYSLMIEGDSNGYSAYVPELPTIVVTGKSPEEVEHRATDAIRVYLEEMQAISLPTAVLHEIEVELPV